MVAGRGPSSCGLGGRGSKRLGGAESVSLALLCGSGGLCVGLTRRLRNWGLVMAAWALACNGWLTFAGVLLAVEVLGPDPIRGLGTRGAGGGRDALNVGRRFFTPPEAALRNAPALPLIPGEAAAEMLDLSLVTGVLGWRAPGSPWGPGG